jgi:Bacteriophage Mu, Gp27
MPTQSKPSGDSSRPPAADIGTTEVVKSDSALPEPRMIRLTKRGKPFREQRRGKIDELPDEVRNELDHRLASDAYRSYEWLSRWLEEQHQLRVSPASLSYRKRHNVDLKLLPVKYATQEARAIVEASGGDNEEINRVLTMLVQTKIFDMLIQMNTVIEAVDQADCSSQRSAKVHQRRNRKRAEAASGEAVAGEAGSDPGTGQPKYPIKMVLAAISTLVKNTTTIGDQLIKGERWDLDRDLKLIQLIEAASRKVSKVASEAGLSPEVEQSIRAALMEIKP